jgi:uncharacterized Zn finger protein
MSWYDYEYPRYVSVAERRAKAQRELKKLEKKGRKAAPVSIEGRAIASTFWGKAWCDHLESYSDYENRLPRGRTYVRNGSVVDLQIEPGQVTALVSGSELYKVSIRIKPLANPCWDGIKRDCAGSIGSIIELLQGKLSKAVMERVTRRDGGMFPAPRDITKSCSCPDWAGMCKHVAAVLYGVGARLDRQPELLFVLRKVDHLELIEKAGDVDALVGAEGAAAAAAHKTLAEDQLADVFGIDLAPDVPAPAPPAQKAKTVRTVSRSSNGLKPRKVSLPAAMNKVDPDAWPTAKRRGKSRK